MKRGVASQTLTWRGLRSLQGQARSAYCILLGVDPARVENNRALSASQQSTAWAGA